MKIVTPSKQQSRRLIAKTLPSGRPQTGADKTSSQSADPAPKSSAVADFCFGAAIDIADALIAKSMTKSSMDDAAWTILTAASPGAVPTLGGLIELSGEGSSVAYPFLAPPASLPQFAKVADVGIELTVGHAVSQAVTIIGKTLLSSHPHLVQCIDLVAGVLVVNLAKKEAHICFDRYTQRNAANVNDPKQPVGF